MEIGYETRTILAQAAKSNSSEAYWISKGRSLLNLLPELFSFLTDSLQNAQ